MIHSINVSSYNSKLKNWNQKRNTFDVNKYLKWRKKKNWTKHKRNFELNLLRYRPRSLASSQINSAEKLDKIIALPNPQDITINWAVTFGEIELSKDVLMQCTKTTTGKSRIIDYLAGQLKLELEQLINAAVCVCVCGCWMFICTASMWMSLKRNIYKWHWMGKRHWYRTW